MIKHNGKYFNKGTHCHSILHFMFYNYPRYLVNQNSFRYSTLLFYIDHIIYMVFDTLPINSCMHAPCISLMCGTWQPFYNHADIVKDQLFQVLCGDKCDGCFSALVTVNCTTYRNVYIQCDIYREDTKVSACIRNNLKINHFIASCYKLIQIVSCF